MPLTAASIGTEYQVIEQANWLINVERYRDAEDLLRRWLMTTGASSAAVQATLSQAIVKQPGRYFEALEEARSAIAQEPENPVGHYILAVLLMESDKKAALSALEQALQRNPHNANYHTLKARLYLLLGKRRLALEAVEEARKLDPLNVYSIQVHAVALLHNGEARQAQQVIDEGLRLNPEDATVHNARGWSMLRLGENDLARVHFHEALRMKPKLENARFGLIHALKARYPLYSWIFRYSQWHQEQSRTKRLLLITLGVIAWFISFTAFTVIFLLINVHLAWIFAPTLIAISLGIIIPQLTMSFYNLFLRFDPFGRLALTGREIWFTNWIIAVFLCPIPAIIEIFISRSATNALGVLLAAFAIAAFWIGSPSSEKYH